MSIAYTKSPLHLINGYFLDEQQWILENNLRCSTKCQGHCLTFIEIIWKRRISVDFDEGRKVIICPIWLKLDCYLSWFTCSPSFLCHSNKNRGGGGEVRRSNFNYIVICHDSQKINFTHVQTQFMNTGKEHCPSHVLSLISSLCILFELSLRMVWKKHVKLPYYI